MGLPGPPAGPSQPAARDDTRTPHAGIFGRSRVEHTCSSARPELTTQAPSKRAGCSQPLSTQASPRRAWPHRSATGSTEADFRSGGHTQRPRSTAHAWLPRLQAPDGHSQREFSRQNSAGSLPQCGSAMRVRITALFAISALPGVSQASSGFQVGVSGGADIGTHARRRSPTRRRTGSGWTSSVSISVRRDAMMRAIAHYFKRFHPLILWIHGRHTNLCVEGTVTACHAGRASVHELAVPHWPAG